MTHTQTTYVNRIAPRAGKMERVPLASVFEKSATELKQQKLQKCIQTIQTVTFNVRTLNRIGQPPELIASVVEHKITAVARGNVCYCFGAKKCILRMCLFPR